MFVTRLDAVALDEANLWELDEPLVWQDDDFYFVIPKGFVTDLASVPPPMRGVLNTNGPSRKPAVLHDWLYRTGTLTRKAADQLFLTAMICTGVLSIARGIYYAGVRAFGWIVWNRYRRQEDEANSTRNRCRT